MGEPVKGIAELDRAFQRAGAGLHDDIKDRLRYFAAPVKRDAELLSAGAGVGIDWSRMRVGAGRRLVYVAPVQRGTNIPSRKRRNFARYLLSRAMEPALNRNRRQIEAQFDELLARIERRFNRG